MPRGQAPEVWLWAPTRESSNAGPGSLVTPPTALNSLGFGSVLYQPWPIINHKNKNHLVKIETPTPLPGPTDSLEKGVCMSVRGLRWF